MVNYNQAYLESLVKPGSTKLSILVDNCQKSGKSGSTRVYQVHQAFNQTFGARVNTRYISAFNYIFQKLVFKTIRDSHFKSL